MSEPKMMVSGTTRAYQGNLLNAGVRRDIAELNRLFLAHALNPAHRGDSWFQLPSAALQKLERAPPDAIERAAYAPIALFQLHLPDASTGVPEPAGAVGDADRLWHDPLHGTARHSFGLASLNAVRRLSEGVPFSPRIAFGLASNSENRLSSLSLSESFQLAAWEGLVRPRWHEHARYWGMLAGAVTSSRKEDLYWAYAAGLCMLGRCEREPATVRSIVSRRARPAHRRGPSAGADVPC